MGTNNKKKNSTPAAKDGYHKKKPEIQGISDEQAQIVDAVQYRMNMAFAKFVIDKGWSNARIADEFYPYISCNTAVTKIMNGTQNVSVQVIICMVLRFGYSLEEILLGRSLPEYVLTPNDIAYLAELVRKAQCSDSK